LGANKERKLPLEARKFGEEGNLGDQEVTLSQPPITSVPATFIPRRDENDLREKLKTKPLLFKVRGKPPVLA